MLFRSDGRGADLPSSTVEAIRATLKSLQEANVNVYAVSPAGVLAGIFGPRQDSLRMFSEDTGGRATVGSNTPWEAVPQIFKENSAYYMLAIRSAVAGPDDAFRRIQVKVDRPGIDVRSRSGYFIAGTKSARKARATVPPAATEKAIAQAAPGGDLPLGLNLASFAVPGSKNAAVAATLSFRDTMPPGQSIEVLTLPLDQQCSGCKTFPEQHQHLTLGPSSAGRAEFTQRLSLPPGGYEIRVAASADTRAGMVLAHIEVPNFSKDRFSASGLVLGVMPSSAARSAVFADLLPIAPTAQRDFRQGVSVTALMRLYQGGSRSLGGVRVAATIRDEADRVDFEQTTFVDSAKFSGARSADYTLELPLAKLEAGPHVLTVDAHLGDSGLKRDVRFVVR